MKNEIIGVCDCCGKEKLLIIHHWIEYPDGIEQDKLICLSCNRILTTENILGNTIFKHLSYKAWCKMINKYNHILPRWELQKSFVKAFLNIKQDIDKKLKRKGYSLMYRVKQGIIKECGKYNGKYLLLAK